MKAVFKNEYKTSEGVLRNAYLVSGTPEELAAYKTAKTMDGDYYREDDNGAPLYTSSNLLLGKGSIELHIAKKTGRVYADTNEIDRIDSICKKYVNSPLGNALANLGAAQLWKKAFGSAMPIEATAPVAEPNQAGLEE